jgi:predicted amidohydrolase YtcJ/acetyl esterase/lipase
MKMSSHFAKSMRHIALNYLTGLILLISIPLAVSAGDVPEVIYFNGKIITLDKSERIAEAVAVLNGKFLAVGSDAEIKKLAGPKTKLVDLQKRTVTPGFIDAHTHPVETMYLTTDFVNCRYPGVPSVRQALSNMSDSVKTAKKGQWILAACVSASQTKFAEKRMPTLAELDSISPDNPVVVLDGTHLFVVNSKALGVIGVKKGQTKLPHGGGIGLDSNGNPNGTLTDAFADVPSVLTPAQLESFFTTGIQKFWNSYGFTTVMGITQAAVVPVIQKVAASGYKPTLRYSMSVWKAANGEDMPEDLSVFAFPAGSNTDYYHFTGIKAWVDGENDARTGLMCSPYLGHKETDPEGGHGSQVTSEEQAMRLAKIAQKNGVICMLHCSGDKAMAIGMTTYENLCSQEKPKTIFRIEHFGVFQMYQNQLDRAVKLHNEGLRISVQPTWLTVLVKSDIEDMGYERAATGFRFRTMVDKGLEPAGSTDVTGVYLENTNPMKAIYATVTRNSDAGKFEPDQALTVTESLKMWTIWAARSLGEEELKGTIEPGKFADMTVISDDILTIDPQMIIDIKIEKTIVGGTIVYDRKKTLNYSLPAGQNIYDPPVPLPAGNHGNLIWATEISTDVAGAKAWKILYRSTDIHGEECPVSGMVIAPVGKAPTGGFPIVSYAHGTTGVNRGCAPSMVDNPAKDATYYFFPDSPDRIDAGIPGLTQMIAAGYVVVATDYQGQGTPGFHQYLIGPTAARNTLDAILAVRQLPEAGAGNKAVVTGWSQGGQAAIWSGQIAEYLTDSALLVGVVAMAPVNAREQSIIEAQIIASGKTLPAMTISETLMAQFAMAGTFPELQLSDVLTPLGIDFIRESSKRQSSKQMGQALVYLQAWKGTATRPDPQNQDKWLKRIEEMTLGNTPSKVPVAVYQGDDDPTIFPAATEAYVKQARVSGIKITYQHYPGVDHLRVPGAAQADFMNWIADRFAGKQQ